MREHPACTHALPASHRLLQAQRGPSNPHLLHSRQALDLRAAEVLLLECGRLQHEVLLLRGVHLLQVLSSGAGLPVQGLLDHLRAGGGGASAADPPSCNSARSTPSLPSCSEKDTRSVPTTATNGHSQGGGEDKCLQVQTHFRLVYLASAQRTSPLLFSSPMGPCVGRPLVGKVKAAHPHSDHSQRQKCFESPVTLSPASDSPLPYCS